MNQNKRRYELGLADVEHYVQRFYCECGELRCRYGSVTEIQKYKDKIKRDNIRFWRKNDESKKRKI